MPSFDIVSKTDSHELANAVDQTNRELSTRFDFKGTNASIELNKTTLMLKAPSDFQVKQVDEILRSKLAKRQVDIRVLKPKEMEVKLNEARQEIDIQEGITQEFGKKIIKLIKDAGLKVQTAIQGDQLRITGKKRDDLQSVIGMLRESKLELPLQFENFRD